MGQQLKTKTILLQNKKTDNFDLAFWLDELATTALPPFYPLTHGQPMLQETYDDDCSYLNAYFQVRETRSGEYYSNYETISGDDDSDQIDASLADRDVDWEEHDRLEKQFILDDEIRPDGFVIIALPDSVFVLAPWDTPDENEETMLRGFDFETIDVPREVIHCFYSKLS